MIKTKSKISLQNDKVKKNMKTNYGKKKKSSDVY